MTFIKPKWVTTWTALSHRLHQNVRDLLWHGRGIWVTVPVVMTGLIGLRSIGLLQPIELAVYDAQTRFLPSQTLDDRIVIITIGEEEIQKARSWPIPDQKFAKVLTLVKQQNPAVIGLDIYRDVPVPLNDRKGTAALYQIFKSTPNLVGIEKRSIDPHATPVKPPPFLRRDDQIGANNFDPDIDGRVRRALFYFDEGEKRYPSFALQVVLTYLDRFGISPQADGQETLTINGHTFPSLPPNSGAYIDQQNRGYEFLIRYRGDGKKFQEVRFKDIEEGRIPPNMFRDRVVLIGVTASSLNDEFWTPFSTGLFQSPQKMAGVKIHAHIISHLLSSTLENRPEIRSWSEFHEWLSIAGWTSGTAILYWHFRRGHRLLVWRMVWGVGLTSIAIGIAQIALQQGYWLPLAPTLLGMMGSIIGIVVYGVVRAAELRQTFGRYLTTEVVNQLLETPQGLQMGGERRTVTMLMADLRGFSSASERQAPEQVITFLNQYLEIMTDVITRHQGTIDEFLGDGILVLFGAPTQRVDDADRAVACAVEMQLELAKVNHYAYLMGVTEVEMGIGVHTGEVVVGNIGSLKRAKYGVVGSHMNLTARIESYTIGGQIFISQATYDVMNVKPYVQEMMRVEAKGLRETLMLYDIKGLRHQMLPEQSHLLSELAIPIPVQFATIEGKQVQNNRNYGLLRQLSLKGAVFQSPIELSLLTNLRLRLSQQNSSPDFYAKVVRLIDTATRNGFNSPIENSARWTYYIHFTFVVPEVVAEFQEVLVKS